VWDGFLRQNQSPKLNEITTDSSTSNLQVTKHGNSVSYKLGASMITREVADQVQAMNVWKESVNHLYETYKIHMSSFA
jgi:hypothetical protein